MIAVDERKESGIIRTNAFIALFFVRKGVEVK